MLTFQSVSKTYKNQVCALDDVSFTIERGEFVYLVGPSGAGKSTILRLLTAEEKPTSGQIIIENQVVNRLRRSRVAALRRRLGVVFQDFRLLPNKTVHENVAFAMQVVEAPAATIRNRVPLLLELVGLSGRQHSYPNQLSGGEQQRVAIARSLINKPAVVLADEPTGNLDSKTRDIVISLFQRFREIEKQTFVIITHDTGLTQYAQRVVRLRDGKIESVVTAS